jgi:hypothetical protein
MPEEKKSAKQVTTIVVSQLPTQEIRSYLDKDDKEIKVVTIEEALTEILEKVTKLERVL